MAEGRTRESWNRTSSVLAMLANVHRDPKKTKPFRPDDFNPFVKNKAKGIPITKANIRMLKHIFVDQGGLK